MTSNLTINPLRFNDVNEYVTLEINNKNFNKYAMTGYVIQHSFNLRLRLRLKIGIKKNKVDQQKWQRHLLYNMFMTS